LPFHFCFLLFLPLSLWLCCDYRSSIITSFFVDFSFLLFTSFSLSLFYISSPSFFLSKFLLSSFCLTLLSFFHFDLSLLWSFKIFLPLTFPNSFLFLSFRLFHRSIFLALKFFWVKGWMNKSLFRRLSKQRRERGLKLFLIEWKELDFAQKSFLPFKRRPRKNKNSAERWSGGIFFQRNGQPFHSWPSRNLTPKAF